MIKFIAIFSFLLVTMSELPAVTEIQTIPLDGNSSGRVFDGIGGISQGGQSRFIIDYPEPQRSQILDYLFLPKFGVSLQTLKIELGGDGNAAEGAEPSHAHTRQELSDPKGNRGYLWWLMKEAKKRNPHITFEALAWGYPGWIGDKVKVESGDPRKYFLKFLGDEDSRKYLITFLELAKAQGVPISYLGIWNEMAWMDPSLGMTPADYKMYYPSFPLWDPSMVRKWVVNLKNDIKKKGLDTKIVGMDLNWLVVTQMEKDSAFRDAVDVIGVHYERSAEEKIKELSLKWAKPLWCSEEASSGDLAYSNPPYTLRLVAEWLGAINLSTVLNLDYMNARVTKSNLVFMINSYYDILYAPGCGLFSADAPWSGHYNVQPAVWAVAHLTQFADPGWQYLDSSAVALTGMGTVIALKNGKDYSVIVNTQYAVEKQTLNFCVKNGLSLSKISVWRSTKNEQFVQQREITPGKDGCYQLEIEPEAIYTLTTTTGQRKGSFPDIPDYNCFPFPYKESFDDYDLSQRTVPKYISVQAGSFELTDGGFFRQTVAIEPLAWMADFKAHAIVGDRDWTDYEVSVKIAFEDHQTDSAVALLGRMQDGISNPEAGEGFELDFSPRGGYHFTLSADGECKLERIAGNRQLKQSWPGTSVGSMGTSFHKLALQFNGLEVKASVDDKVVVKITDTDPDSFSHGMVGLATGWNYAKFDELEVKPIESSTVRVLSRVIGKDKLQFQFEGKGWKTEDGLRDKRSKEKDDSVSFRFSGRRVRLITNKGPDLGILAVTLDGQKEESLVDLYEPEVRSGKVMWVSPVLSSGEHMLKIKVTGNKNPGSADCFASIEATDVVP